MSTLSQSGCTLFRSRLASSTNTSGTLQMAMCKWYAYEFFFGISTHSPLRSTSDEASKLSLPVLRTKAYPFPRNRLRKTRACLSKNGSYPGKGHAGFGCSKPTVHGLAVDYKIRGRHFVLPIVFNARCFPEQDGHLHTLFDGRHMGKDVPFSGWPLPVCENHFWRIQA